MKNAAADIVVSDIALAGVILLVSVGFIWFVKDEIANLVATVGKDISTAPAGTALGELNPVNYGSLGASADVGDGSDSLAALDDPNAVNDENAAVAAPATFFGWLGYEGAKLGRAL